MVVELGLLNLLMSMANVRHITSPVLQYNLREGWEFRKMRMLYKDCTGISFSLERTLGNKNMLLSESQL